VADAGHRRPRPRFDATFVGIRSGVVEIPLAVLGADAALAVSMLFRYSMGVAAVPYCSSPLVTMRIHVPGGP
jgi:hypothetical protein